MTEYYLCTKDVYFIGYIIFKKGEKYKVMKKWDGLIIFEHGMTIVSDTTLKNHFKEIEE